MKSKGLFSQENTKANAFPTLKGGFTVVLLPQWLLFGTWYVYYSLIVDFSPCGTSSNFLSVNMS